MNIAVVPGRSSKAFAQTFGPDMTAERIADFYYAYWYGALEAEHRERSEFADMVRRGELICSAVWQSGDLKFMWGNHCLRGIDGPYVRILFAMGEVNAAVMRAAVRETVSVGRTWNFINGYGGEPKIWIADRHDWPKKMRRLGVTVDPDGWIERGVL